MMTGPARKKKSYSAVYKIYRRIRYVRHRRRSIRKEKEASWKQQEFEQQEIRSKYTDHIKSEREWRRAKARADKMEDRKLRAELAEEIRLRKEALNAELQEQKQSEKERRREELKRQKKERKRLARQYMRGSARTFIKSLRSINARNIREHIREFRASAPVRRKFFVIAFNSTVLYLGAYLFLFLLSQMVTVLSASFFDYPTIVYYYEVFFNISPEAWFHDSVKTIFSSGPLFNLVAGISFLIIYMNIRDLGGTFKLFFLWGFLHAVNMLFGAMLVGTLFEAGVGHVISWMYVMDTGKVVYSLFSIFVLFVAGLLTTRSFLISGNSYFMKVDEHNRSLFMVPQVLLPYFFGNLFMILLRQPRFIYYDTFVGLTLILSLVPVMIAYHSYHDLYFEEEEKKARPEWIGIILLAILVLIFRGLFGIGISFGG